MDKFSKKLFSETTLGEVCIWLVIFIAFGYPVTVSIPVFLGMASSTPINMAFRVLYVGMSFFLILSASFRKRSDKLTLGSYFIICFWIIYSVRIFYDVSILGLIPPLKTQFYIYSFALGNGLIALIGILLSAKFANLKTFFNKLYIFLFLGNSLTILLLFKSNGFSPDLFESRAHLVLKNSGKNMDVLNPILIGYYGEVLALVTISKLMLGSENKLWTTLILLAGTALGLLNLVLGASRGPLISFVLILLIIITFHLKTVKKGVVYFLKAFTVLLIILYFSVSTLAPLLADTTMINRFKFLLEAQSTTEGVSFEARDINYSTAWAQFKESPIIGDQYILTWGGYPHNIYLEVLMATGLLGAVFFYSVIFEFIRKAFRIWRYFSFDTFIILIITLTSIFSHFTSGNLYTCVGFWVLISFFSAINTKKSYKL